MIKQLMSGMMYAAFAATLSGCVLNLNSKGRERPMIDVQYGLGADAQYYPKVKLPESFRTTPAHSDDTFLSGKTTTENPSGFGVSPKVRAEVSAGSSSLRGTIGGEVRYSITEVVARKQQASDKRDEKSGSFAYTEFGQTYTLAPIVGIEAMLDRVVVRVEGGLPYSRFTVESGHDRYNKHERVQHDAWSGTGKKLGGSITYLADSLDIGVYFGIEKYDAELAGRKTDIESFVGGLQIGFKW